MTDIKIALGYPAVWKGQFTTDMLPGIQAFWESFCLLRDINHDGEGVEIRAQWTPTSD